jgi:capsular polysaccharide transport system permease protein
MVARSLQFAHHGAALLYHRQLTIFDLFVAGALLETLSNIAALIVSGLLLYVLGIIDLPKNFGLFLVGYFYMIWWSVAVALIMGALSERGEVVEKIWAPMGYMYLPISGFFFLAVWLPDSVRYWALTVMPALHAYEMIRSGLLGPVFHAYYDLGYVSIVLTVLTIIGLKLMRDTAEYLVLE